MSHTYDVTIARTVTVRVAVSDEQQEPEQLAREYAHKFWDDASLTRAQTGATRMHILARSHVVTVADLTEPQTERAARIRQLLGEVGHDARQDVVYADDIAELSGLVLGLLGPPPPAKTTIYFVTQHIDIETDTPHGPFSTPELAVAFIKSQGTMREHAGGRTFTAIQGGALWAVDEYTVDALVPRQPA